jgi:hypothetical protein
MTLEIATRLAVLAACAVAAGYLVVRMAAPPPSRRPAPMSDPAAEAAPARPRAIPGAVTVALMGFVLVAGGSAVAGVGFGLGEDPVLAAVRISGIGLLLLAGLLAAIPRSRRGRLGGVGLVGPVVLAWVGAGLALAAPIVLLVAALATALLGLRVVDRPRS